MTSHKMFEDFEVTVYGNYSKILAPQGPRGQLSKPPAMYSFESLILLMYPSLRIAEADAGPIPITGFSSRHGERTKNKNHRSVRRKKTTGYPKVKKGRWKCQTLDIHSYLLRFSVGRVCFLRVQIPNLRKCCDVYGR